MNIPKTNDTMPSSRPAKTMARKRRRFSRGFGFGGAGGVAGRGSSLILLAVEIVGLVQQLRGRSTWRWGTGPR
jgi:hypothetical protein